jgi:hypothetical protein
MMKYKPNISRREFMKLSALGIGSLALTPFLDNIQKLDEFPNAEHLGRNTVYSPNSIRIWSKPSSSSTVIRSLKDDECVTWLREVVGEIGTEGINRRWVETPEGYIYGPRLQPVQNEPNQPVSQLTIPSDKGIGMWAEVTVPYVNLQLANPPARAPWLGKVAPSLWRLYYSQVIWVDEIRTNSNGQVVYRVGERYGSYGDLFYADASAFRPLTPEEVTPIHPDVVDKKIRVNINHQTVSCYEGNSEIYYCQVSTGQKYDVVSGQRTDEWATPLGTFSIWRKLFSIHMAGGSSGAGWDTMGVPWTTLFASGGVAIHSTHWHNDYGAQRSHGCVNAKPEDAKWIFRWTKPSVDFSAGDRTDNSFTSTQIFVVEQTY